MLFVDLFLLRDRPFRYAGSDKVSPWILPLILISVGSLYGFFVAFFQRSVGGVIHGVGIKQISDTILFGGNMISGIFILLIFHGGVTMLVWLMAKGVGGPGRLAVLYRTTSFLLPAVLPALPFLAARSALSQGGVAEFPLGWIYLPLAVYAFVMMVAGLFNIFKVTQQVSVMRCIFAVLLLLFFSSAVLLV